MHMILVIVGGIVTLGLFLLFGYLWGGTQPNLALAAMLFIPVWAMIALSNMWIGVTRAGYSVKEELPVLLVVFSVPALLATIAIWRMAR